MNDVIKTNSKNKGIYLLPNLFTTAALFAGFYAIVAAFKGLFEPAAIAIFAAMVMDSLDGRVARLTGTQSEFGAEYDSLSDMACFGLTPALVAYSWGLQSIGKIGWLSAFFYVAATGLRLARFNVKSASQQDDNKFFIGLPCPAAAAVVASLVWILTDFEIPGNNISVMVSILLIILGCLMVSNVKYYSFKTIDFKNHVSFKVVLGVVLLYILIAWATCKALFLMSLLYALSGPTSILIKRNAKAKKSYITSDEKYDAPNIESAPTSS